MPIHKLLPYRQAGRPPRTPSKGGQLFKLTSRTVEVQDLGRITIPASFREALGIGRHDTLLVTSTKDGFEVKPFDKAAAAEA